MSFKEVFADASSGGQKSIEKLIAQFSKPVEEECARYGLWEHPDWSHSDLIQEVFLKVFTSLHQFRGVDSKDPEIVFAAWVRTTARNVVQNLRRNRTTTKRWPEGQKKLAEVTESCIAAHKTASSIFVRDETTVRLQEAVEQLPPERREVVLLRLEKGLSMKSISEQLGLTYEQVRYRWEKALEELQAFMN